MSVFDVALASLFADPNMAVDVDYRVGGHDPAIPVRAVPRQPDLVGSFGETRILSDTTLFDLPVSDVTIEPAPGDTITWAGTIYQIQGEAMSDVARLIWTVEARPQ